jgi:hypothetical protein
MPNATRDLDTQYRANFDYQLDCAAAQTFYKGTIVGLNAAGQAGVLSATFNKVAGIHYLSTDAVRGPNASPVPTVLGEKIQVRRGCHRIKGDGSITAANVFAIARAIDNQTVGMAGGIAPCGVIERVDADGYVWVNFDVARAAAASNGVI